MKMHAIQTGTVAIKTRQVEGVGHGSRRQLNMFLEREWTDPLPIHAFAIEHPEGVIVVDTGETARTSETDYFPSWHPYYRYGLREWVAPDEEIGPQLRRLGITPSDVRWVVLTHLHTDHAGGLHHFPHNQILVSRGDLTVASGRRGRLRGYPNQRIPRWFDPTVIDLSSGPYGPFPQSLKLTKAGDVTIVPVPGHTPGQIGVIVEDGPRCPARRRQLLHRGTDAARHRRRPLPGRGRRPAHAPADPRLAAATPTVYLVAHDPETATRLTERRTVKAPPIKAAA
jgi:N-acyl homoserine lactone hydrolase